MIVVRWRFTRGHRTVGEEEDATIMEEPGDGLHEKHKYGRYDGRRSLESLLNRKYQT